MSAESPVHHRDVVRNPRRVESFRVRHDVDQNVRKDGYNRVVGPDGEPLVPHARPMLVSDGARVLLSEEPVADHNVGALARVFFIFAPVRDILLFDLDTTTPSRWAEATAVLERNGIKTAQRLSDPVKHRNYYSSKGIFEHLKRNGPDYFPTMRYLDELELNLKCRLFAPDFDFVNREGHDMCPSPGQGLR